MGVTIMSCNTKMFDLRCHMEIQLMNITTTDGNLNTLCFGIAKKTNKKPFYRITLLKFNENPTQKKTIK